MPSRPHTQEEKDHLSAILHGRPKTTAHRLKISLALKGKPKTEKAKANMRGTKGRTNPWNKGIKRPEISGAKHPRWLGGKFRLEITAKEWGIIRIAVLRKNGWTCQGCGKTTNTTKLSVHHIIPYRLTKDNSLENLMVFCAPCHMKTEIQFWKRGTRGRFEEKKDGKM
jgi:5-methylcytosine-specific restriction endonuclease McrA